MPRRRKRNPLLMRILGISILAHILFLPVLAHYGAFKQLRRQFIVGEVKMITLPPQSQPPEARPKQKPQKSSRTAKKASKGVPHAQRALARANLNQPRVAIAHGNGGDAGGGVVEQGNGKAGDLPTPKTNANKEAVKALDPEPKPISKPETKPEPQPLPTDQNVKPQKVEPRPEPLPVPPHQPVFSEAVQTYAPQPNIPDDLRSAALDKTVVVEIKVDDSGKPTDVSVIQSAGNEELDNIAVEAARKWKFKPATRDGQTVESRVRLHIEFQVS